MGVLVLLLGQLLLVLELLKNVVGLEVHGLLLLLFIIWLLLLLFNLWNLFLILFHFLWRLNVFLRGELFGFLVLFRRRYVLIVNIMINCCDCIDSSHIINI